MSIYLDEKNPEKHKPFDDASPDIAAYVRYLEVIAGKSPNTAFSYYCDLRNFSRFMKRRRHQRQSITVNVKSDWQQQKRRHRRRNRIIKGDIC